MAKIDKHIEVVRSSTHKESIDPLVNILKSRYTHVGVTNVDNIDELESLVAKQPDLVFLRIKKLPGPTYYPYDSPEIIWIPEYLEKCGINYTGSTVAAVALESDKAQAKQVVRDAGLETPAFYIVKDDEQINAHEQSLDFPLFVKPLNGSNSAGIGPDSVVHDLDSLKQQILSIIDNFHGVALIEEYLPGRELSVALFKDLSSEKLLAMPIEVNVAKNDKGDRILGSSAKREDIEHFLAVPEGRIRELVIDLAKESFEALGARDFGRIDIRLDKLGVPSFMEANLIPGVDEDGYLMNACRINRQMDYETMILQIVSLAFSRQNHPH